jgi:hypothetical protein
MLPSGSKQVKGASENELAQIATEPDFAGFTLTQFRHSYIPIGHIAAVRTAGT